MYRKDQDLNQNNTTEKGMPVQLTKEEMRQKIRASLAAREAAEEMAHQPSESSPAYAAAGVSAAAQKSSAPTSANRARMEKARQIRETMASQRTRNQADAMPPPEPIRANKKEQRATVPPPVPTSAKLPRHGWDAISSSSSKSVKKILLIFGIILVLIVALFYIGGIVFYNGKYLPNTYVNGIHISGMTKEEAEEAIIGTAQDMGITFVTKSGEDITFNGSSFGCVTSIPEHAMDEVDTESHAAWFVKLFSKSEYTIALDQTYSEDALSSLIAAYDWGNIPPTDASIQENADGTFYIQPEDDGNMVDTEILSSYALDQIRNGHTTIDMEASGCYMKAAVTAASLEGTLDLYEQYGSVEITFDMTNREELFDPVGTVVLDHKTFMNWISFDSDGTLKLDKEQATAWVQENIVEPYDTFCAGGYTRSFQSTMDGTVQLTLTPTSTYGWKTDVEATVDMLEQYLQDGESVTTEPEWVQAGFRPETSSGVTFEEGTYIEIDICHQHLWFYVDGELYLDSDVVTGLASDPDRATRPGIFKIRDRIRNAVLGTYEVQGYEAPVSYWMPIDHTGIGLHDLSRSAYGGDIYLTNGSHGCINLPLDVAAAIFEKTVVGMPVVIIE